MERAQRAQAWTANPTTMTDAHEMRQTKAIPPHFISATSRPCFSVPCNSMPNLSRSRPWFLVSRSKRGTRRERRDGSKRREGRICPPVVQKIAKHLRHEGTEMANRIFCASRSNHTHIRKSSQTFWARPPNQRRRRSSKNAPTTTEPSALPRRTRWGNVSRARRSGRRRSFTRLPLRRRKGSTSKSLWKGHPPAARGAKRRSREVLPAQ